MIQKLLPIKTLIIEDEALVALGLKQKLESMGIEVIGMASSGKEALVLAKQYSPDLISCYI